jgi:hypothetical protein
MLFEASWSDSAEPNFDVLFRSLVTQTVKDAQMTLITVMKMSAKMSSAPDSSAERLVRVVVGPFLNPNPVVLASPPFGPDPWFVLMAPISLWSWAR